MTDRIYATQANQRMRGGLLIKPFLPPAKRLGRTRTTDLRDVVNALLYLMRTGFQGRILPREFPPRRTVQR